MPAVRALDDPATRLAAYASQQGLFAAATNVWSDPALSRFSLGLDVVVALVEAEVLRTTDSASDAQRYSIERRANHPLVVHVGGRDLHGDGDAACVGQDMAFDAAFAPIRGVRTRMVPPFGAFTIAVSRLHHFQSTPRQAS